jgi:uncharacterized protein YraI
MVKLKEINLDYCYVKCVWKKKYLCGVKRWKASGVVQQQGGTTRASITNRYLTPQSFYLLSFKDSMNCQYRKVFWFHVKKKFEAKELASSNGTST